MSSVPSPPRDAVGQNGPEPGGASSQPPEGKGAAGLDGPISTHVNRPLMRRVAAGVADLPVTADQWTWAGFAVSLAGAAAFALHAPRAGAVLVQAGALLDTLDGEVARRQGTAGPPGALLDLTLDRVSDVALLAGLAAGAGGRTLDWALALAAANGIVTASVVKERLGAEGGSVAQLQRDEVAGGVANALLQYLNRDVRQLGISVCGLLRQPRLALLCLAAGSNWRLARRLGVARELLRRRAGS